ncbi:nucleotidyltransferase domain-containing protein [Cellulomonas pakistanensis]|nr:nucleotidyltransferase domain-containing protein [Cellulomonas pakistanensis]
MTSVLPSAHGPVLAVLYRSGQPLTGRQVAELTHPRVSQSRTAEILRDLASAGLVSAIPAGAAVLYRINEEHLLYDAVVQLSTVRERLWERIATAVSAFDLPPLAVVVFGSAARGDGHPGSDIDLLVVLPEQVDETSLLWWHDLDELTSSIRRWTGNDVDLLTYSSGQLAELAAAGERLLAEIRRDGRFVVGSRSIIPSPEKVA